MAFTERDGSPPLTYLIGIDVKTHGLVTKSPLPPPVCALCHAGASTKFQSVTDRNLDRILFPVSEVVASFLGRNEARLPPSTGPNDAARAELSPAKLEALNEHVMATYAGALSGAGRANAIPVQALLANQLIAVKLATTVSPSSSVLMRLGTGQGKSLVLTLAAIFERECADRPSKVFVVTSYAHLAERDHAFAQKLLDVRRISSCVLQPYLSSLDGFASRSVVFADLRTIDSLVRSALMQLLEGAPVSEGVSAFLRTVFCLDDANTYSVLLDEYDLLVQDLENDSPYGVKLPSAMLKYDDVVIHSKFYPRLKSQRTPAVPTSTPGANDADGSKFVTYRGSYFKRYDGSLYYFLVPTVFRLGPFLRGATRVIGLSGSTDDSSSSLPGRSGAIPVYELPSSQDPQHFETCILPTGDIASHSTLTGSAADLRGHSGIWLQHREVFGGDVGRWCSAIVEDVRSVQAHDFTSATTVGTQVMPRRPVLIFVPAMLTVPRPGGHELARDVLQERLLNSGIVSRDSLNDIEGNETSLSDDDIQRIGKEGTVTLADHSFGRGIDIRVSIDIPGGLHVIIATSVLHSRLLRQMVGRTGRLGREGSYSILALDNILLPPVEKVLKTPRLTALHLLTGLCANHLLGSGMSPSDSKTPSARRDWVCKWLLFMTAAYHGRDPINEAHFEELLPAAAAGSASIQEILTQLKAANAT